MERGKNMQPENLSNENESLSTVRIYIELFSENDLLLEQMAAELSENGLIRTVTEMDENNIASVIYSTGEKES